MSVITIVSFLTSVIPSVRQCSTSWPPPVCSGPLPRLSPSSHSPGDGVEPTAPGSCSLDGPALLEARKNGRDV